jgi:hypothetical protein
MAEVCHKLSESTVASLGKKGEGTGCNKIFIDMSPG